MSKLGKKLINVPKETKIQVLSGKFLLNGPKGTKEVLFNSKMFSAELNKENSISIRPLKKEKDENVNKIWGMTRSLLNNAVIGVTSGYEKVLEMSGVGYRASIKENKLILQLGFSHNVEYLIPQGIKLAIEKQTIIKLSGNDKAQIGSVAAEIKSFRPTEPYKGKGIKERGQYILRKEGKKK